MEQYLSEYLFIHHCCPIPGAGELQWHTRGATYSQAEQTMIPPISEIRLVKGNVDETPLVGYLARMMKVSADVAANRLQSWSTSLTKNNLTAIPGAGVFESEQGKLVFRSIPIHLSLIPEVKAERVVRKETTHAILVGDRERDTQEMAALLTHKPAASANRWWIFALVLLLLAAGVMAYYFVNDGNSRMGSAQPVPVKEAPETYIQNP